MVDVSRPIYSKNDEIRVFKSAKFFVIDSKNFNVQYDGVQFLKVRECGHKVCGICGNHNSNPDDDEVNFDNFLADTNTLPKCLPARKN